MRNLNIKATVSTRPSVILAHEIPVITRGATAELFYNLTNKVYDLSVIDQLTFIFKQNKTITWYSMFTYLTKTTDTSVVADKIYYTAVEPIAENSYECTARIVAEPESNPAKAEYYEICEDNKGWTNTYYMLDEHFYHYYGEGYDYISFNFSSAETKELSLTTPENNMQFEVAIRLNTDSYSNLRNSDSVIIEPQHSIAVVDSLYSKIR